MHFLKLEQVMQITGLSRSSIYNYISKGTFPKSIKKGPKLIVWLEEEIKDWMLNCVKNRG